MTDIEAESDFMLDTVNEFLVKTGAVSSDGYDIQAFCKAAHRLFAEFDDAADDALVLTDDVSPALEALNVVRMALLALHDGTLRSIEMHATNGYTIKATI